MDFGFALGSSREAVKGAHLHLLRCFALRRVSELKGVGPQGISNGGSHYFAVTRGRWPDIEEVVEEERAAAAAAAAEDEEEEAAARELRAAYDEHAEYGVDGDGDGDSDGDGGGGSCRVRRNSKEEQGMGTWAGEQGTAAQTQSIPTLKTMCEKRIASTLTIGAWSSPA